MPSPTLSVRDNFDHKSRKKIAVYYYAFMGGGAEAVALWILEALQDRYDLTLFTTTKINFAQLNSMYGTQLSSELIKVRYFVPDLLRSSAHFLIANNEFLRKLFIHALIRYFKANQNEYDLLLSAYNATDLGRKGIQYIHWIKVVEGNALHHRVSQFSKEQMLSNISVANSYQVAAAVKKQYDLDAQVVYPPVVLDIPEVAWDKKEKAFICSGRLTEAKQPHKVIQILSKVRAQGFEIKLYITGGGGGVYAWKYRHFLKQMVTANSDWVKLYENLEYKTYINLLAQCKYGIHYKKEPFGISIAEMLKAGAIPFVRSQGGQVEIVGDNNQELLFDDEQEAVEKIISVLSNSEKQQTLLSSLKKQKNLFSTDKFVAEVNELVTRYFQLPN